MENQPRRRRRPALSCFECRRRKIKCDRQDPCTHCVATKTPCLFRNFAGEPARLQLQDEQPGGLVLSPSALVPSPLTQPAEVSAVDAAGSKPEVNQDADLRYGYNSCTRRCPKQFVPY